jgi:hypothetical protein
MQRNILIGFFTGLLITAAIYEIYAQYSYDQYLRSEYEKLASFSDSAFFDLDSQANRFVQSNNLMTIYRASKENRIDPAQHKRLTALFSTRMCISYEDENNHNLSQKMCKLARDDYSLWKQDNNFESFKQELVTKRDEIYKSRESNQPLHPSAKSGAG